MQAVSLIIECGTSSRHSRSCSDGRCSAGQMGHGGTNFGFNSGANVFSEVDYRPVITSYDYVSASRQPIR
jgi:hypothetical protein